MITRKQIPSDCDGVVFNLIYLNGQNLANWYSGVKVPKGNEFFWVDFRYDNYLNVENCASLNESEIQQIVDVLNF